MFPTILAAFLSFTAASLYILHHSLRSKLHATHQASIPPSITSRITSLPEGIFVRDAYNTFYDRASRPVLRRLLPSEIPLNDLFTRLIRRNLAAFAHFPQAWLLFFTISREHRYSFSPGYIASSEFDEGDRVCGVYSVASRRENQVEMEMVRGAATGRMVISYEVDELNGTVVFSTETIMWMDKERGKVPLENTIIRFFHEMTAWWLMDSGVRYLMDLEGVDSEEKMAYDE